MARSDQGQLSVNLSVHTVLWCRGPAWVVWFVDAHSRDKLSHRAPFIAHRSLRLSLVSKFHSILSALTYAYLYLRWCVWSNFSISANQLTRLGILLIEALRHLLRSHLLHLPGAQTQTSVADATSCMLTCVDSVCYARVSNYKMRHMNRISAGVAPLVKQGLCTTRSIWDPPLAKPISQQCQAGLIQLHPNWRDTTDQVRPKWHADVLFCSFLWGRSSCSRAVWCHRGRARVLLDSPKGSWAGLGPTCSTIKRDVVMFLKQGLRSSTPLNYRARKLMTVPTLRKWWS